MKLLFYKWNSFMNEGLERGLEQLQLTYDTFFYQLDDWESDTNFKKVFTKRLYSCGYDCVLSINYVPLISDTCEKYGIRYIAWVYDSPIHIKNLSSMKNSCNEIYLFDRGQVEELQKKGMPVRHMPLAVDTEFWEQQIKKKNPMEKQKDISFVGQLYKTEYNYFMSPMDDYIRGYLEGIVNVQGKIYGGYLIPELVTDKLLNQMNMQYEKVASDGFQMGKRELEFLLASEVTYRERYTSLALLANHFQVNWYTGDEIKIPNVIKYAYADYLTQMPVIFHDSKINLNISLKTIRTGIPLRALDIMGCHGFLLSNFQTELAEYFVPNEECVLYENIEDMYEKCTFYLKHNTERQKIADAGYKKVKSEFTFKTRLSKLLGC